MIKAYLNQEAIIYRKKQADKFGQKKEIPIKIKCRLEKKNVTINIDGGKILVANGILYTTTKCEADDFISYKSDKYKIVKDGEEISLNGKALYFTYYLGN
jgi:hypothetical protein